MQHPHHVHLHRHDPQRRSRFGPLLRELWFQVVLGAVLGIAVGFLLPAVGKQLTPLSDWFIALVKMIVIPVVFCVVSLGIASMDSLRKAGRIGVKALGYFLVLSLVSMLIGLVVANVFRPGAGMNIDPSTLDASKIPGARPGEEASSSSSPTSSPNPCSARSPATRSSPPCWSPSLFGCAMNVSGEAGASSPRASRPCPRRLQDRRLGHAAGPARHLRRPGRGGGQLRRPEPAATRLSSSCCSPRPASSTSSWSSA